MKLLLAAGANPTVKTAEVRFCNLRRPPVCACTLRQHVGGPTLLQNATSPEPRFAALLCNRARAPLYWRRPAATPPSRRFSTRLREAGSETAETAREQNKKLSLPPPTIFPPALSLRRHRTMPPAAKQSHSTSLPLYSRLIAGAPRKMGPGRGSWFWGCFAGAGRALNAAALYIWILNAFFASWLYITRLAPWVFGAVPSPRAAHFSLWVFYFLSWIFWVLAWWHDPGTVTGARVPAAASSHAPPPPAPPPQKEHQRRTLQQATLQERPALPPARSPAPLLYPSLLPTGGAAREAYRIAVAAIAAGDAEEARDKKKFTCSTCRVHLSDTLLCSPPLAHLFCLPVRFKYPPIPAPPLAGARGLARPQTSNHDPSAGGIRLRHRFRHPEARTGQRGSAVSTGGKLLSRLKKAG